MALDNSFNWRFMGSFINSRNGSLIKTMGGLIFIETKGDVNGDKKQLHAIKTRRLEPLK